jgi:stearoyl-CoA desaturase (Delta-9 desaturase)
MYILLCVAVFIAAYVTNITTISVLYHRGLAHRGVRWGPRMEKFTAVWGIWLTGLDPKAWVCMHRMHHAFSDTERDPHSPTHQGLFGVLFGQLRSYERVLVGLARRETTYTRHVTDLNFPINWLNRKRLWLLPYAVHIGISLAIAIPTGWWALGLAYYFGIMSHPLQGWAVNALGHAVGGRNFDTPDDSRNNALAAWLICGEGLQNNHHRYPSSAKFSYLPGEPDAGWAIVRLMASVGLLEVDRAKLIPAHDRPLPLAPQTPSRTLKKAA